jgi:2-methylcitrate dehydratase PrpD
MFPVEQPSGARMTGRRTISAPHVGPVGAHFPELTADQHTGKHATHSGARTSASQAAYVNGTLGHSCEFDDAHALAWHTASAVVPAALALAERENAGGPEVITAVTVGIQVMSLLGAARPASARTSSRSW